MAELMAEDRDVLVYFDIKGVEVVLAAILSAGEKGLSAANTPKPTRPIGSHGVESVPGTPRRLTNGCG
jgi:hypothetical protein